MSAVIENHHDDHHHGPAKGITRWLYTTNHKDIGTLYLWFSFAMFLIGGAMAMVIRAELFQPGMQIVEPEFYNQMITLHGSLIHHGINKCCGYHNEYESSGYNFNENAFVCLVLVDNSIFIDSSYACFSWRCNDDVNGYPLRNQLL